MTRWVLSSLAAAAPPVQASHPVTRLLSLRQKISASSANPTTKIMQQRWKKVYPSLERLSALTACGSGMKLSQSKVISSCLYRFRMLLQLRRAVSVVLAGANGSRGGLYYARSTKFKCKQREPFWSPAATRKQFIERCKDEVCLTYGGLYTKRKIH